MLKIPVSVEKGFIVFCLLLSTGITRLLFNASEGETSPLVQVIWLAIYIAMLPLLLALWKQAVKVIGRDKLLLILIGIAGLSAYWSIAPGLSLRRSVSLIGTNLFGLFLAVRYSLKEQLQLLGWALGIGAVLSLVVAIVMPSFAIESSGALRGIYNQKNVLARLMVVGAIIFLLLALSSRKHRWIPWSMFGLSILLTLLSTSKTGLTCLVVLLLLFVVYRPLRLRYTLAIPALSFIVLTGGSAVIWLLSNSQLILKSLGKDATLTGRTELWDILLIFIGKRPILGYGYGAFWTSGWDGPAGEVWRFVNWQPLQAHNGYINLWVELGLLGLLVFLLQYLLLAIRTVGWVRLTKTAEGFWPLLYVSYMLLYNQTESSILLQNNFFWIVYVALSLSIVVPSLKLEKQK